MSNLDEVLASQLAFCERSGLEVDVHEALSTVAMTTHGNDLCFLQGFEAETFIEEANKLYNNEALDLYWCDACSLVGYPYLELGS